jgi:hypothetical protein
MANTLPNKYELRSDDGTTQISYFTTNLAGTPTVTLVEGGKSRSFLGSQIRTVHTEVGSFVSVTTRMTLDAGSTSFSILIPAITLKNISDRVDFATQAIVTTHSGPIAVPRDGVHESYEFVALKGHASLVVS